MILKKIISGGQTGADIAGVKAAKDMGLETGGTMPKGFLTLGGLRPEYAKLYNMQEHSSSSYPPRTYENVKNSDATMSFVSVYDSPGEILTRKAAKEYKKFCYSVKPNSDGVIVMATRGCEFIEAYNISVLNVAGNSERRWIGAEKWVYEYLINMIKFLRGES